MMNPHNITTNIKKNGIHDNSTTSTKVKLSILTCSTVQESTACPIGRILDKARDPTRPRVSLYLVYVYTVIGHGLRNLCHQKNAIMSVK